MATRDWNYDDLPIPERLQLVEDIWDSIAREANARPDALPLSEAQRTELRRRAVDADLNPEQGASWDEVRRRVFRRGE
jgi:putative addiction module component (TIGR02574 family)